MLRVRRKRRPCLVSFSGIDGAGKSTQIERFCRTLGRMGLGCRVVRFWDEVATFRRIREGASSRIFRGDRGVGSPEAPVNRRDKNVRSWYTSIARLVFYGADALSVRIAIGRVAASGADVVVFDRYLYDELANLNLQNPLLRLYAWLLARLTPAPDIRYVLDAEPAAARRRKPEYPLEFLVWNRRAYLDLGRLVGGMTIIPPMPVMQVEEEILRVAAPLIAPARDPALPQAAPSV